MFNSLSDRLQDTFGKLRGKGRLTEDDINTAMREIRMALLEADVNYRVVKKFVAECKEKCMTAEVLDSLSPAQNVVRIVLDQLTELLGTTESKLVLAQNRTPNVIMLVGLQGSGKTTAAAKLAFLLKRQGHSPLLAACDVHRPAAADQLETLGNEIGVKVYRGDGKDAVKVARESIQSAVDGLNDIVIVDTAGRLQIDEQMMQEAVDIKNAVKPDQVLMVVDAMTGQDIVNVVSEFANRVDFDGVIMSKLDGDARGGGALSVREVTGKPIKFVSMGEKPESLEVFHPDRMAKRILGMGDVVSIIEEAQRVTDQKDIDDAELHDGRHAHPDAADPEDGRTQADPGAASRWRARPRAGGRRRLRRADHAHRGHDPLHDEAGAREAQDHKRPEAQAHREGLRQVRPGGEPAPEAVVRDGQDDGQDAAAHQRRRQLPQGAPPDDQHDAQHGHGRKNAVLVRCAPKSSAAMADRISRCGVRSVFCRECHARSSAGV